MAIQNEPTRIAIPFADSGSKNTIPDTNSTPSASQAASWTDGFPAQCSLPLNAGGIPPARADFNGIFNALSQSIRFGQEGGIFAWSSAVDYDAHRLVRGSNGRLYWSVAQSGPNVGAGAKNPVSDDGTYWASPQVKTMPLLDLSAAAASTEWVRYAMGSASLYVDGTSGDDSRDGTTQAKAVKTIARAMALARNRTGDSQLIYIAAGTYSESISVYARNIEFSIQGNVTVGKIYVYDSSNVIFSGSDTLTVTASGDSTSDCIHISSNSYFYASCPVAVSATGMSAAIRFFDAGGYFSQPVSITSNGTADYAFVATHFSHVFFESSFSIGGSGANGGVCVLRSSSAVFGGGCSLSDMITGRYGVLADLASNLFFLGGAIVLRGSSSAYATLSASNNSFIGFVDFSSLSVTFKGTSTGACIYSADRSAISITVPNGVTASLTTAVTAGSAIAAQNGSYVFVGGSSTATLSISGTFTTHGTVWVNAASLFTLSQSITASGSPTGKRYAAEKGSVINVNGGGASRIPGSSAGTADATQFAYYG